MDEEKTTKEDKPEDSTKDSTEGIQSETTTELDRADQIAERQKRENDRREKLIEREENLAARRTVGGESLGYTKPIEKKETDEEYAERFQKGEVNPLEDDGVLR